MADPRRQPLRLAHYDYAQAGAYFVTLGLVKRQPILGEVVDGAVRVGPFGSIVLQCWHDLPTHYAHVVLDAFAVLPDHVHGIIVLIDDKHVRAGLRPARTSPTGSWDEPKGGAGRLPAMGGPP